MSADLLPFSPSLTAVDEHVYLIGRPPVGDVLQFVRLMAVDGRTRSQTEIAAEWRRAHEYLRELETKEAGIADDPMISTLAPELEERRLRLLHDPLMRAYDGVPADLFVIDLDRVVVFQRHIDLTHVAKLQSRLPEKPSAEELFDFCLPVERDRPPVRVMQTSQNSYTFVCPSNDFRFVRADLLEGARASQFGEIGTTAGVLALELGFGSNLLHAIALEGRLILHNGSHRAYALRERGIRYVPCVVQRVARREELELAATSEVMQRADLYLRAKRPPVLKDYFDPALRTIVPVARKNRLVRVSFGVDTFDVPA
jgi:hypothetical protein